MKPYHCAAYIYYFKKAPCDIFAACNLKFNIEICDNKYFSKQNFVMDDFCRTYCYNGILFPFINIFYNGLFLLCTCSYTAYF